MRRGIIEGSMTCGGRLGTEGFWEKTPSEMDVDLAKLDIIELSTASTEELAEEEVPYDPILFDVMLAGRSKDLIFASLMRDELFSASLARVSVALKFYI